METDFCIINNVNPTYIDRKTGLSSHLDLVTSSANIAPDIDVTRLEDVGSDHFPIMAEIHISPLTIETKYRPKWKYNRESLNKFSNSISPSEQIFPTSVDEQNTSIVTRILEAAKNTIKKSSGKPHPRPHLPWWDSECSVAVNDRRRAYRILERHPTPNNLSKYIELDTISKNLIRNKKASSWREFVNNINHDTPPGVLWRYLSSMKGKSRNTSMPIMEDNTLITSNREKAECFGKHLSDTSKLGTIVRPPDMNQIISSSLKTSTRDSYNSPISRHELDNAIKMIKMTSPGEDELHNIFFRHLPEAILQEIFQLFFESFETGYIPCQWKSGIILPIQKPTKPPENVSSYRPICLLPCLGKLMERIIQRRLNWFVEENELMAYHQCGFRRGKSTKDVLMRLTQQIQSSLEKKSICLVVYIAVSYTHLTLPTNREV